MGPAGLVSIDDGEVMALSQNGIESSPEAEAFVEMGGTTVGDEDHMVTETAIRGFYERYREVMGL